MNTITAEEVVAHAEPIAKALGISIEVYYWSVFSPSDGADVGVNGCRMAPIDAAALILGRIVSQVTEIASDGLCLTITFAIAANQGTRAITFEAPIYPGDLVNGFKFVCRAFAIANGIAPFDEVPT